MTYDQYRHLTEARVRKAVKSAIRRLAESDEENVGWHAGDLGKAEAFAMMSGLNRDTGHFGTGTYFVGDPKKLDMLGYAHRPRQKVSFDGYNLVKIKDFELARMFHDALKYINNTALRDMVEKGSVNESELKKKCHIIATMLFSSQINNLSEIVTYRNKVYGKVIELLEEYSEAYKNNRDGMMGRTTISTELLKSFGFQGVDTRGCPDMDNVTYGSVIYDLKESIQWPSYFHPTVNSDGTVTIYHGLKNDALAYVLENDQLTPKVCAEGAYGLWFSVKGRNDYPSGYPCLISLRIPMDEIGTGYSKPFNIMNETHLKAERPISITDYSFKVEKIAGITLDKEWLEYMRSIYNDSDYTKWFEMADALRKSCNNETLYFYLEELIAGE